MEKHDYIRVKIPMRFSSREMLNNFCSQCENMPITKNNVAIGVISEKYEYNGADENGDYCVILNGFIDYKADIEFEQYLRPLSVRLDD